MFCTLYISWIIDFDLTSTPGCDAAGLLWADPRLWPVRTGGPTIRLLPPQTVQTNPEQSQPDANLLLRVDVRLKTHLQSFVEPAVSTVGERPAPVQHLSCLPAGVPVSQSLDKNTVSHAVPSGSKHDYLRSLT